MNCPHARLIGTCPECHRTAQELIAYSLGVVADLGFCQHQEAERSSQWCRKCGARWTIDGWQRPRLGDYARALDLKRRAIDPDGLLKMARMPEPKS